MNKLKKVLLVGLQKISQKHTIETLGDRKDYLGASEIGYCPRKIILEKIHPGEHDLETLFRFRRGHMAEDIIAEAFTAAGYTNFERQVEAVLPGINNIPLTAHIDFVFTNEKAKIKSILEIKSTETIPASPYGSWESQIHVQTGLLAKKHPDYSVKGAILVINLNSGDMGLFNGYQPSSILDGLITRAEDIWFNYRSMLNGDEIELNTEVSPLCGFCDHITTCPKFQGEDVPELADSVNQLMALQKEEKKLQGIIKEKKKNLLTIVEEKGPIVTGEHFLQKANRNNRRLDMDRLESFMNEIANGTPIDEFKVDHPYSFLEIRKAKKAA